MELNKKNIYFLVSFIVIFIFTFILIIYFIWFSPKNKAEGIAYKEYNLNEIEEKVVKEYARDIMNKLAFGLRDEIYNKLDNSFIENKGITRKNLNSYLNQKGYYNNEIRLVSYKTAYFNEYNIYILNLRIKEKDKVVIIKETYPYKYTIIFEDTLYNTVNSEFKLYNSDMEFAFKETTRKIDFLEYRIIIKNNSNENVEFDFKNIKNFIIELEDGIEYEIVDNMYSPTDNILKSNSYTTKILGFNIQIDNQAKIKKIKFKNVTIGNVKKDIELNI